MVHHEGNDRMPLELALDVEEVVCRCQKQVASHEAVCGVE